MSPRRERRGAHSVEFALLLPVYVILVTSICDFGWMAFHAASLYGAAHVGCRQASLIDPGIGEYNLSSVIAAARSDMTSYFEQRGPGCGDDGCLTSAEPFGARPGRSIRCAISIHYEPVVGYVVPATDLVATAVVRLEYQRGGAP